MMMVDDTKEVVIAFTSYTDDDAIEAVNELVRKYKSRRIGHDLQQLYQCLVPTKEVDAFVKAVKALEANDELELQDFSVIVKE